MQKEIGLKTRKKRPVGRPRKERKPLSWNGGLVKVTAQLTEEDDRTMVFRWRDSGSELSYGRWFAAEAMTAVTLREEFERQKCLPHGYEPVPSPAPVPVDVHELSEALSASLGAVIAHAVRAALNEAREESTREIAQALIAMSSEVSNAVVQSLIPRVDAARSEARAARMLVEQALGISKD